MWPDYCALCQYIRLFCEIMANNSMILFCCQHDATETCRYRRIQVRILIQI